MVVILLVSRGRRQDSVLEEASRRGARLGAIGDRIQRSGLESDRIRVFYETEIQIVIGVERARANRETNLFLDRWIHPVPQSENPSARVRTTPS